MSDFFYTLPEAIKLVEKSRDKRIYIRVAHLQNREGDYVSLFGLVGASKREAISFLNSMYGCETAREYPVRLTVSLTSIIIGHV